MLRRIIIPLILITLCLYGRAQHFAFKHISTADGLLSDLRLVMTEDRMGRLWIASDEGINVFDGSGLISYSQPDNSGLISNYIQRIYCDRRGTIWIKGSNGIQYKKEADTRFTTPVMPDKEISNTSYFGEKSNGDLVCITPTSVYLIDQQLQTRKLEILCSLIKGYGTPLTFDHFKGDQFFIGYNKQLLLVDVATQQLIRAYNYRGAWSVCPMSDTTVMTGSFVKDTIAILNLRTGEQQFINHWKTSDGLPVNGFAGTIQAMGNNRYAIGCRTSGVYIVDAAKQYAQHLMPDDADASSMKTRFCRRLLITRNRTLFLHTRGLSYTQIDSPQIQTVKYIVNEKKERYGAGFTNFIQDKKGNMWISTNAHLVLWNKETGISKYYPFYLPEDGPQKFKTVRAVALDKLDRIWAFSFGAGLGMLKPDGKFEIYNRTLEDRAHSLPSAVIHGVGLDNDHNFIVCTDAGFALFDPISKKTTTYFDNPAVKHIASGTTYLALADKKNNWWLAQEDGLFYFDRINNRLQHVSKDVPDSRFQALAFDSSGVLYAGSRTGLYTVQPGSLELRYLLGKKEGLVSEEVTGLLCDRDGQVWIIGNRGLASYDPKTRQLENIGPREGIELSNHTLLNYYQAPDGELYIGSSEGFNHFYPEQLKRQRDSLNVFISAITLPDSLINISEQYHFTLSHSQNNISFSFMAVDYTIAAFIQYRYKLTGFDTAYIYSGKQRQARYTNLPPGDYTFIVEASGNGKDWHAAAHPLHITIKVAYWKSWWFRLLVLTAIAGLVYLAYHTRVKQINKEAQLKVAYEIKLNELEISALRAQMNPHFIFNSLNTINAFINQNNGIQANQYISKFSKLIRLILDHSRQKKIPLADELAVVELHMQMEQIRFEDKFSYTIEMDPSIDADTAEMPPMIIQPFVENAILHGLRPADYPGRLNITVSRSGDHIVCTIQDNGIGREKAKQLRKQEILKRQSHGMEITLKRISLFNQENGVKETVTITDLQDPTGTKVTIPLAFVESF